MCNRNNETLKEKYRREKEEREKGKEMKKENKKRIMKKGEKVKNRDIDIMKNLPIFLSQY